MEKTDDISERFYSAEGEIFFGRKAHEESGTNTIKYAQRAAQELNDMRADVLSMKSRILYLEGIVATHEVQIYHP